MRAGRYWMRLSRFLMMAASWPGCAAGAEVAQAVLHVRPGALDRVEVRGVGRQLDDGQPVLVRPGEGAHRGADVRIRLSHHRMTGARSSRCAAVTRPA